MQQVFISPSLLRSEGGINMFIYLKMAYALDQLFLLGFALTAMRFRTMFLCPAIQTRNRLNLAVQSIGVRAGPGRHESQVGSGRCHYEHYTYAYIVHNTYYAHAMQYSIPSNVQYISLSIHSYPLLPNSSFHFSKARNPSLLTLGLIFRTLVAKSSNPIGRISSRLVVNNASPNDLKGPIAASFVNAVISDPEKPIISPKH